MKKIENPTILKTELKITFKLKYSALFGASNSPSSLSVSQISIPSFLKEYNLLLFNFCSCRNQCFVTLLHHQGYFGSLVKVGVRV